VTRIKHINSHVHVHMPATILLSQSINVIAEAGFRVHAKSDAVKILAGTSSPVAGFITTAIHEPTVRANHLTYHHHHAKLHRAEILVEIKDQKWTYVQNSLLLPAILS
jgi:hypothetical protein